MKKLESWQLLLAKWIVGILAPGYSVHRKPPKTGKGSRRRVVKLEQMREILKPQPGVSGVDE